MPSSHRWHGQEKTVLSCLDPVSNFQVFRNPQCILDWTVANWKLGRDKTKLCCLVAICVHTADTDKTRQDSFVLSMSAVWTTYKIVERQPTPAAPVTPILQRSAAEIITKLLQRHWTRWKIFMNCNTRLQEFWNSFRQNYFRRTSTKAEIFLQWFYITCNHGIT